jgi:Tol biopolymer transport system component
MLEADEDYRRLAEKGKRIVRGGQTPTWSPNGKELAYSRQGYSGIEIINLETGQTRMLTVPGQDPSWSPDGQYIAYTRDRRILLLTDLANKDVQAGPRSTDMEEIWLIKADGTEEPRFLTKGKWPCWHRDSKHIFYCWVRSKKIYSLSIEQGSEPKEIAWCPSLRPGVLLGDKDVKYIAHTEWHSPIVHVLDKSSRSRIASWAGFKKTIVADWSPDGSKLSVTGYAYDEGLWVYDMQTKQASRFLGGKVLRGRWSPDGEQMVFALGPPFHELWVANTESLEPGLTLNEHCLERVSRFTNRIESNPEAAWNYVSRAKFNSYLGETNKTLDDLERYEDLVKSSSKAAEAYGDIAWQVVRRHQEVVCPEIAVTLSRKAHEKQPENWSHLCALGAAQYRVCLYQEAITELKRSTKLTGGDNAVCYFFSAMAHWQSGNQASATDWYNKAIEWIEDSDNKWYGDAWMKIYEAYLEASELMEIETRDF